MAAAGAMGPVGLWKSLASLPARANGGDVMPNQPYLVGERGPEVFLPQTAGAITPSDRLARSSGSTVVINNHFAPGTDLRTIDQAANLIGLRVQRAMRRST
jgi:SLT domain-containing protein